MNIKASKSQKSKSRSFFVLLTIVIGLSLVLSYLAFSPSGSFLMTNVGLSANIHDGALLAQAPGGSGSGQAPGGEGSARLTSPLGSNGGSLEKFLNKILDVVILLGAIVIVFMIILAGLRYVLAKGDEGEIKKAHTQLTWTAIGAAILLGAKVIAMVITNTVKTLSQ